MHMQTFCGFDGANRCRIFAWCATLIVQDATTDELSHHDTKAGGVSSYSLCQETAEIYSEYIHVVEARIDVCRKDRTINSAQELID